MSYADFDAIGFVCVSNETKFEKICQKLGGLGDVDRQTS